MKNVHVVVEKNIRNAVSMNNKKCCMCDRIVYEGPKCIFHCAKDTWLRNKQWDENKCRDFWYEYGDVVSDFYTKEVDLSNTIFPHYLIGDPNLIFPVDMYDPEGLGREDPYVTFYRPINFSGSIFLGKVDFQFYKFKGVNFKDVIFIEDVSFKNCIFDQEENIIKKDPRDNQSTYIPAEPMESAFTNASFFTNVDFRNSKFSSSVSFNNAAIIKDIIFTDVTFKNKVTFHNLNRRLKLNKSKFIFNNTKFLKLADFWNASFFNISFNKTDFEEIVVFTDTIFLTYFAFKYTRFEKQLIFNRTKIMDGFDLYEAIFSSGNVVFTDIKFQGQAKHKETYRLIKFLLEKRANYIEADDYYVREMKMYRKESFSKNKLNWILLAFGKVISNYGNSWILPVFWMIFSSLMIFFYMYLHEFTKFSLLSLSWMEPENINIFPPFIECLSSKEFLNFLNPFSRGTIDNGSVFSNYYWAWSSQKIISAIGMYHLIVALKRKTRR